LKGNVEVIKKYEESQLEMEMLEKEIDKWKLRCF
jgi:hypothetical protein